MLSVNQSVTWTLQNPSGHGKPPTNATLNPPMGNSTTFTYTSPLLPCSSGPAPVQVEVVATTSGTPAQVAVLTVTVEQTPPCLAALSAFINGKNYTSCPPPGTLISQASRLPLAQVGVFTQAAIAVMASGNVPLGVPPFTWTLSGSLPTGFSLVPGVDTTSMTLSGTPISTGCSTFQLQVTDANGGQSCDPNVTTSCVPTTFYIAAVPAPLKVQLPSYPFSYDGVPYPPISLVGSGGVLPYTWVQDPSGNGTLPPGLGLSAFGSNPNFAVVSGTPNPGDSDSSNGAGSPNPGFYPSLLQVSDSQLPYPAVGEVTLQLRDYTPPPPCSSSPPSPLFIQPTGPNGNGGLVGANSLLAESYMQGTYAFMMRGFDANQPTVIAGSVVTDGNGNVTSGVVDTARGTSSPQELPITGGSYALGVVTSSGPVTYNRGCMTLTTAAGTQTFDFTLGGCSNHYSEGGAPATSDNACGMLQNSQSENAPAGTFTTGRIIEADDGSGSSAQLSGILRAQDTSSFSAGLSGPYAFGLGGWDAATPAGHYAMAGSMQAKSASLASVAADINDAGSLSTQLTGGSGTLGAADPNTGRIAATLTVGQASFDLAIYMVSATEALIITTDPLNANHPLLSGEAITTASSFSSASLQNSHMLAMGGVASAGPDVSIGVLTFDGVGAITGTIYEDQAATLGTTTVSAIYAVDGTTGRTPFSAPQVGQTLGAHAFVAYLIPPPATLIHTDCSNPASCVTGFIVGIDSTAQDGVLEFQTQSVAPPPPFNNRFVAGDFVYGSSENLDSMTTSFEGDVFGQPSSSAVTSGSLGTAQFPFFEDASYCLQSECPLLITADTRQGSYTVNANGTGTFGGGTVVSVTNGNVVFYIDESPANSHPSVNVAEQ